jgi:hypothetical protein
MVLMRVYVLKEFDSLKSSKMLINGQKLTKFKKMNYQNKKFVVNYSNYTEKFTFDQVKNSVKNNTSFNVKKLTQKEIVCIFFELNEC